MTSLVLGLALAVAAPASKQSDEPPPAKLEGDWVVESFEGPKDGAPPGTITFHFADGKISITEPQRKGKAEAELRGSIEGDARKRSAYAGAWDKIAAAQKAAAQIRTPIPPDKHAPSGVDL